MLIRTSSVSAQQVLRQIGSVLAKESEGTYLSRVGTMAVGPKGDVFVSDLAEGRILQIATTGKVVGSFARQGNGPGEVRSPSSRAFIGDSLFVFDYTQKRILLFQVATRKFIRSFTANFPSFTQISASGSELIAQITDPKTFTSVTVLSPAGATVKPTSTALNVMRVTIVIQLVIGIALWLGRWTPMVDLHRTLGIVYVLALWLIATLAIAHDHKENAAGFAIMWGALIITLGFAQQTILPGEYHWITQIAHLLIGIAAIPMAEVLVKGAPVSGKSR